MDFPKKNTLEVVKELFPIVKDNWEDDIRMEELQEFV